MIVGLPQISFSVDPNVFLLKNLLQVCILNTILKVFFLIEIVFVVFKSERIYHDKHDVPKVSAECKRVPLTMNQHRLIHSS